MTAVLVSLEGRSLDEAIERCLGAALTAVPARKPALSVWLSGALARPFVFGPVQGLRGWHETHQAAATLATQLCGIDGPCRVVLEGDPSAHTVLGTAVQEATLDALYRAAATLRVRLRSIRPAWAEAMTSTALASTSLLACRDADSLTLLGLHANHYDLASTYAPRPSAAETGSLLRRLQLARDLAPQKMREASITATANGLPTVAWCEPEQAAA